MSEDNQTEQTVLEESLNSSKSTNERVENQSHTDTNVISIETSEDFQHIDTNLSQ